MASFIGEWKKTLMVPAVPVIWAATSLLTIFAGPFGTHDRFSPGLKAVFWPVLVAVTIILATGLRTVAESVLGLRRFRSQAPVLASLLTLLLTPPLFAMTRGLQTQGVDEIAHIGEIGLVVFAISIGVSAIRHALAARMVPPQAKGAAGATEPRLLARLPRALRAPLLRLSVRDHYVEVTTEAGRTSVLMRLADAIAETDGVAGLQIHRSHWVADKAVRGAKVTKGRPRVVLSDGAELPVSQRYRAEAVARGLLPGVASDGPDVGGV